MTKTLLIALFLSITSAANGALIIDSDTTWSDEVNLTEDVQIGAGATLTISAGAVVTGNRKKIKVQGTLKVEGTADELVSLGYTDIEFLSPPSGANLPLIDINFADLGEFDQSGANGTIKIQNSIIREWLYIWYPEGSSLIKGNKIGRSVTVLIQSGHSIVIENNVFTNGRVIAYANYGSDENIVVAKNSFIDLDQVALEVSTINNNQAGMLAINNYYGTTDISNIESRILDVNDDLARKYTIKYQPILTDHHPDTPANRAPIVSIVEGNLATLDTDGLSGETVSLSGSASDQDGTVVTTQWFIAGEEVATGLDAVLNLPNGTTSITLKATDDNGESSETSVTISVSAPEYVSVDGWPAPYNGVTAPLALGLSVNNIGAYDEPSGIISSCLQVNTDGFLSSIDGVSYFDVNFQLVDAIEGLVRVVNSREFNIIGALNEFGELPDCSGVYETTTGVYSDVLQTKWLVNLFGENVEVTKYFDLSFELFSPETLTLKLKNYQELSAP